MLLYPGKIRLQVVAGVFAGIAVERIVGAGPVPEHDGDLIADTDQLYIYFRKRRIEFCVICTYKAVIKLLVLNGGDVGGGVGLPVVFHRKLRHCGAVFRHESRFLSAQSRVFRRIFDYVSGIAVKKAFAEALFFKISLVL